jgi:hypothetical protein
MYSIIFYKVRLIIFLIENKKIKMEFRMEAADGQYKREFCDRLTRFRVFVQNCAQKKNEDADEQYKEVNLCKKKNQEI